MNGKVSGRNWGWDPWRWGGRRFGQAGVGKSIDQVMESELDAEQGERDYIKLFEPWITGTNQNQE